MKGYTVFAVVDDEGSRRYAAYVEAESAEAAERQVIRGATAGLLIAGVVEGHVLPAAAADERKVVALSGRGYETSVARITIEYQRRWFPFRCPSCRSDLRQADAIYQWDWWDRIWHGRLPRAPYVTEEGHVGITVNQDLGARSPTDFSGTIVAVVVQCARCKTELWNGYHEAGSPEGGNSWR